MKHRDVTSGIVIAVALAAVLAAFALGFGGLARTSTGTGTPAEPPADGSEGVVVTRETTPKSFLGVRYGTAGWFLVLGFVVTEACADATDRGAPGVDCPAAVAVGTSGIAGRTADGHPILSTRLEVSGACFGSVGVGDPWPLNAVACPGESATTAGGS